MLQGSKRLENGETPARKRAHSCSRSPNSLTPKRRRGRSQEEDRSCSSPGPDLVLTQSSSPADREWISPLSKRQRLDEEVTSGYERRFPKCRPESPRLKHKGLSSLPAPHPTPRDLPRDQPDASPVLKQGYGHQPPIDKQRQVSVLSTGVIVRIPCYCFSISQKDTVHCKSPGTQI